MRFVVWKWGDKYSASHVNFMYSMLDRHYDDAFTMFCVTDDMKGIDDRVARIPMPKQLVSTRYPRQSRRLWVFSDEAGQMFGPRFCQLDLDQVIVDNVTDLFNSRVEPFVVWKSPSRSRWGYAYNPSVMMMNAGARRSVWDVFNANPDAAILRAAANGWPTRADQSVISDMLAPTGEAIWTKADGIYSLRDDLDGGQVDPLPDDCKIVSFYGRSDPSDAAFQAAHPWVLKDWHA